MSRVMFPAFLDLSGRRVLVVGGGPVAASKLKELLRVGAKVTVVAPDVTREVLDADVEIQRRGFESTDLEGAWFVVAAAPPAVNQEVARLAREQRIFVNAVDDKAAASAYLGGIVRRGGVTVAISTEGRAPAMAGLLREGLDALLPKELDDWMHLADEMRRQWKADRLPMPERRPALLDALNSLYNTRQNERRSVGVEAS